MAITGDCGFNSLAAARRYSYAPLRMKRLTKAPPTKAIVIAALSIVLLVWAFVITQVRFERREADDAAIRANSQRAMAFEQYVVRTLNEADIATSYIANQYASTLQSATVSPVAIRPIDETAFGSAALREINVINRNGDLVATSARPLPSDINLFHTDVFQWHLSRPSTALKVNAPSRSRFSAEWLLLLSRRVNLADGSFGGTVSVQIRPRELTDFLQHATLDETDLVSVIGLDGITRARREGNALSFGQNLQGKFVMRMQEKAPYGNYVGPSSLDGLVRYFSHRRLPQYNLFVTSGVSEAAVLAPVKARANGYFAGGAIITIATILAAWLMITIIRRRFAHEAEILIANERLQDAQQLAKLGDWSFDIKRKQFRWSADLCAMYERSAEQNIISLAEFAKLVGQHGIQIFQTAITHSHVSGGRYEFELAARLPSGAISHRRIVSVPHYDAAQQLIGIHGTDQDVTPRKLLESLKQQVSQLSKLDAMNAIAATLAHELNQPLTAASNYLSGSVRLISAREDKKNDVIVEALMAVREQIYNAGEIIRRVRNMVDNGQSRSVPVSLADVIVSAITQFQGANPESTAKIETDPDIETAIVSVDPIQIQQILVNLIRNAQDASHSDPNIKISTKRSKGAFIDICVTDNGPGITRDVIDPFSSFTTSKRDGIGLGLAISRTLIESMGGKIWIEKTGPTGTIVCFSVREFADEPNNVDNLLVSEQRTLK